MKTKIFIGALLALLFTSCEKQEPVAADQSIRIEGDNSPDNHTMQIENLILEQGKVYTFEEIKELAPNWHKDRGFPDVSPVRPKKRIWEPGEYIVSRTMEWQSVSTCGSPYCTQLGQEIRGLKGPSNWVQIASSPSFDPWRNMYYTYDPKPLMNDAQGYHAYQHYNYNSAMTLTFNYIMESNYRIWVVDIDQINLSGYGTVAWLRSRDENYIQEPWTTNENAIIHDFTTCCIGTPRG